MFQLRIFAFALALASFGGEHAGAQVPAGPDELGDLIIIDGHGGNRPINLQRQASTGRWRHHEMAPEGASREHYYTVEARQPAGGTRATHLVIRPVSPYQCSYEGEIASDLVTITGTAICDSKPTPFVGRITRGISCAGFDGRWGTTRGPMILTVSGDQLSGTYGAGGQIRGRLSLSNIRAEGEWIEKGTRGRFSFTTYEKAMTFDGQVWDAKGRASMNRWNGSCAGPR